MINKVGTRKWGSGAGGVKWVSGGSTTIFVWPTDHKPSLLAGVIALTQTYVSDARGVKRLAPRRSRITTRQGHDVAIVAVDNIHHV